MRCGPPGTVRVPVPCSCEGPGEGGPDGGVGVTVQDPEGDLLDVAAEPAALAEQRPDMPPPPAPGRCGRPRGPRPEDQSAVAPYGRDLMPDSAAVTARSMETP